MTKKKTTKKKTTKKKTTKVKDRIPFTPAMLAVTTQRKERPLSKTQTATLDALKASIEPALRQMVRSGHFMLALWWFTGSNLTMRRITNDFPVGDFDNAVDTLDENLRDVKRDILKDEYDEDDETKT